MAGLSGAGDDLATTSKAVARGARLDRERPRA